MDEFPELQREYERRIETGYETVIEYRSIREELEKALNRDYPARDVARAIRKTGLKAREAMKAKKEVDDIASRIDGIESVEEFLEASFYECKDEPARAAAMEALDSKMHLVQRIEIEAIPEAELDAMARYLEFRAPDARG